MTKLHYLAYGSNLHPLRLGERIPSSRPVGLTQMPGWKLAFHKRGSDGSGKCNLLNTSAPDDAAFAAIYEMDATERPILDQIEGAGYAISSVQATIDGVEFDCFVYLAEDGWMDDSLRPRHWYREIVLLGAQHHGLPGAYCSGIASQAAQDDPDPARAAKNAALIERLRVWPDPFS